MASDYEIHQLNSSDLSEQDLNSIADIISTAFRAKFAHVGLDDDQTRALNKAHILDNVRHPKNVYFVARRASDGAIAGVYELLLPVISGVEAATSATADPDEHLKQFTTSLGFWRRLRVGKLSMVMSNDQEMELVEGEAYVKAIAVNPDCRGQGLGNRMLAHAHELAARHGFTKISLHVAGTNQRARQLYERVGYVEDKAKSVMSAGERAYCRFHVGEDGFYYLTKDLS